MAYANKRCWAAKKAAKPEAEAIYDYDGSEAEGTLTLAVGDRYRIIDHVEGWYTAECLETGDQGFAPSSYIDLVEIVLKKHDHLRLDTDNSVSSGDQPGWKWLVNSRTNQVGWVREDQIYECQGCDDPCHKNVDEEENVKGDPLWGLRVSDDDEDQNEETEIYLVATYAWKGNQDGYLSLREHKMYLLLEDFGDGWVMVRDTNTAKEGIAPQSYFDRAPETSIPSPPVVAVKQMREEPVAQNGKRKTVKNRADDERLATVFFEAIEDHVGQGLLPISKGTRFEHVQHEEEDNDHYYWVKNLATKEKGYVRKTHVRDVSAEHKMMAQRLMKFTNVPSVDVVEAAVPEPADSETDDGEYMIVDKKVNHSFIESKEIRPQFTNDKKKNIPVQRVKPQPKKQEREERLENEQITRQNRREEEPQQGRVEEPQQNRRAQEPQLNRRAEEPRQNPRIQQSQVPRGAPPRQRQQRDEDSSTESESESDSDSDSDSDSESANSEDIYLEEKAKPPSKKPQQDLPKNNPPRRPPINTRPPISTRPPTNARSQKRSVRDESCETSSDTSKPIPKRPPPRPKQRKTQQPTEKKKQISLFSKFKGKRSRSSTCDLHFQIDAMLKSRGRVILKTTCSSSNSHRWESLKYEKDDEFEYLARGSDNRLRVVHLDTTLEGEVEESDVKIIEDSLWNNPWYHGRISKVSAFTLLKFAEKGTYLVRRSADLAHFTLQAKGSSNIYNWKIMEDPKSATFSIDRTTVFPTMLDLIKHYSGSKATLSGADTNLRRPAVREKPQLRDDDSWEVNRRCVKPGRILGKGYFGEVREGKWTTSAGERKVAIKALLPGRMSQRKFLEEADIMKKLQHPNILRILGVVTKKEPIFLLSELMEKGSLRDYILNTENCITEERHSFELSCHICSGMAYLESRNFVHRDLAARNILVDGNGMAKVSDFGLTKALENEEDYYQGDQDSTFPQRWAAIECIEYQRCTTKSDVWSFGVVMWEIFSRCEKPYSELENFQVLDNLKRGNRLKKMTQNGTIDDDVYNLMRKCWNKNPDNRPPFCELKSQLERLFQEH